MIPAVNVPGLHARFHGECDVYAVSDVDITLGAGEVLGQSGSDVTSARFCERSTAPQQCCRPDSHPAAETCWQRTMSYSNAAR